MHHTNDLLEAGEYITMVSFTKTRIIHSIEFLLSSNVVVVAL